MVMKELRRFICNLEEEEEEEEEEKPCSGTFTDLSKQYHRSSYMMKEIYIYS